MNRIFFILLCFFGSLVYSIGQNLSSTPGYTYVSPMPGSKFIMPETAIAFSNGRIFQKDKINNNLFAVVGSKSSQITGQVKLSDDALTLLFYPEHPFKRGERIEVKIYDFEDPEKTMLDFYFDVSDCIPVNNPDFQDTFLSYDVSLNVQKELKTAPVLFPTNDTLPDNFPEISLSLYNDPSAGYTFVFPMKFAPTAHYLTMLDNYGTVVFYRKTKFGGTDFKKEPNGLLSWYDSEHRLFFGMDSDHQVVDAFAMGNGYSTDLHELRIEDNGHYWCLGYDSQLVGMDTVVEGGHPNATVTGLIVQELDSDDNVVFQWRSWDHFKITDASSWINLQDSVIDYVHGNSIAFDSDTSILISCRNMNEITKIDRRTGNIIWRMNGENDMFEWLTPGDIKYTVQHSIREMDNGHFSIFDNASGNTPPPHSSNAIEYDVDEENFTVTEVKRIHRDPPIHADFMGHTQRLPNGNLICGWGPATEASATEFDADGNMLHEFAFPYTNYRAFKFDWKTTLFDLDVDTLDFGNINDSDSVFSSFRIINPKESSLVINRIIKHESPFSFDVDLPLIIPAHSEQTVDVKFYPGSDGVYFDVFTICTETDDENLQQRVSRQIYIKGSKNAYEMIAEHGDGMRIFPNPSNGNFRIESKTEIIREVYVNTIDGKLVWSLKDNRTREVQLMLNGKTSKNPGGIYLMRIVSSQGNNYFKKLVIN